MSSLSQRFEKRIHDHIIVCDDIVICDRYKPFFDAFVHVFRNSLDHGIESQEERILYAKDELGTIAILVSQRESKLIIDYQEDGRGLDLDKIKSKAIEKGLATQEELPFWSDEEIMRMIFLDTLSTKDVVTDISGRGVGLASLKYALDLLGGEVAIENTPKEGVRFIFTLPYDD